MKTEILEFCISPRTRDELASRFRFESQSYIMKSYILPMVAKGKILMIIPEKPKSKFQKYVAARVL